MRLSRRNTMTLLGASACFALASPLAFAATRQWSSTHFAKSPLVGNIYDRSGLSGQTLDDLKDRAAASRHVMLGEIHPNPDHHRLQAEFLSHMVGKGRKTCRGFRNGHTGPAAHPGQADGKPARRSGQHCATAELERLRLAGLRHVSAAVRDRPEKQPAAASRQPGKEHRAPARGPYRLQAV
jgi:hypothetical protein